MKVYRDFYKHDRKFTFFVEGQQDADEIWNWLRQYRVDYTHEWSGDGRNGFSICRRDKDGLLLFSLVWGEPLDYMAK
jgi:hypothetical protein